MTESWKGEFQELEKPSRGDSRVDGVSKDSDEGVTLLFTAEHDDWRHVAAWSRWLWWDDMRWSEDRTLAVFDQIRKTCRAVAAETKSGNAMGLASAKKVAAVHMLARADRRHAATVDQWDADQWSLNTPSGIVDLRTGQVRPHRREDYHTKITAVGPTGDCPRWHKFLDRVTGGDTALCLYLQRLAGYSLTGSTREHVFVFLYGAGANGKSVFITTLAGILDGYATTAPIETFIASHSERHPTDLASLRGARMVTAVETEAGRRWAESKLKMLTGGDKIAARFMRQDFFEFVPQFKLIVAGNHRPGLRSIDEAIRRRLHLVPFTVTIPEDERDDELVEKLREEWPGILAWAIEGAQEWAGEGLAPPDAVRRATDDYLAAEDSLGQWLQDSCFADPDPEAWAGTTALFCDWKLWAERAGERPGNVKQFSQAMVQRGYERRRGSDGKFGFAGLRLNPARDT